MTEALTTSNKRSPGISTSIQALSPRTRILCLLYDALDPEDRESMLAMIINILEKNKNEKKPEAAMPTVNPDQLRRRLIEALREPATIGVEGSL